MHGMVNRAIQRFLRDTYGPGLWATVAADAGVAPSGFEAMLTYDDSLTDAVLASAAARLGKPRDAMLEDLGIFLVSLEPLRRLLRFGGPEYADFLESIDELPGRAQLAVPDIGLPDLELRGTAPGCYMLICRHARPGFGAVLAGVLRAMADDYGALALIEAVPLSGPEEFLTIELLEARFAEGRSFHLAYPGAA
jgi:Haem-NO-binding